jgi:titin
VVIGDQVYPATNGNNLYFALPGNIVWVGNVASGSTGQTLASTYINTAQLASAPANIRALALDATDPANFVIYAGDDPSGIGTIGAGRWFQTTQTAAAPDVPKAPLNVVARENGANAVINWSPAQSAQKVTSYTVHNNFASNGAPLADVTVLPSGPRRFPPTSVEIPGLASGVVYQFQVLATNAQGSSPYSAPSNTIPLGVSLPGVPTAVQAIAGDAQASVSWTLPQSVNGITSYTVTALLNGSPTSITSTVPAPAPGSSSGSAIVSGLTNGSAYTFTVHATSAAGSGEESLPSLPVTPLLSNVPNSTIVVNGPPNVASVPTQVTYTVVVQDASPFPIFNVNVNSVLSTTDGAFIISATPDAGICSAVGSGITQTICHVPSMAPGQLLNITVVTQMNAAAITLTSTVTALDQNGSSLTFSKAFRTGQPTVQPPPSTLPTISLPVSGSANPSTIHPGNTGILTWTVSNGTTTPASNVVFTITIDPLLAINSVTVTPAAVSCSAPAPGLGGNLIVCRIANLGRSIGVQSMTMTVGVTAPPPPANFQFLPSGTVKFDGNDSSNSTATLVIRVK